MGKVLAGSGVFPGIKTQRYRIHAVTQASWIGAIPKYMSEVRVTERAPNFAPHHSQARVHLLIQIPSRNRSPEPGPARARFKFGLEIEQRVVAGTTPKNTRSMYVHQFAGFRCF